ncbi:ribosome silencing factor [Sanguibacter sp. A247]|uniref:ribosome silencing factor n=1 Tax=unclassified Sanguibacter TaxID=2645534 RepID=UPI003FD87DE2
MPATQRALDLAVVAARAAGDLKAEEIIALDVSEQLVLTDVFLIASASNERQVTAISDAIEEAMHKAGSKLVRREGRTEARWILLDFGEVIAHVQHAEDRVYYSLERLWKDCPVVELPADLHGAPAGDSAEQDAPQA